MTNNILVVKLGGGAGNDTAACLPDLAQLARTRPLIIVHGLSARLDALCAERGIEVRTLTSPSGHTSRYTDAPTRDLFVEVAGQINADLCAGLQAMGVNAVSAGQIIRGNRKDAVRALVNGRILLVRDDYSGRIESVDGRALQTLLNSGCVPVVSPLAWHDIDGWLNIDGDRAAAAVAASLHADDLVILSNVAGLYRAYPDEASLVPHVPRQQIEQAQTWAQGRMKRKVLGAAEALDGGVQRVVIGAAMGETPVSQALNGRGTVFS
jgi:[amino group carrier protein]-L-2-aminoadipate 6-kinase